MYESNITVADFVNKVKNEVNAVPPLSSGEVVRIINDIQTSLYLHVIRSCRRVAVTPKTEGDLQYFSTSDFESYTGEAMPLSKDVVLVCASDKSIHFGTIDQFYNLSIPICCRMNDKIYLKNVSAASVMVHYIVTPIPITYGEVSGYVGKICMPSGYLTLLEAGVLAEMYRHMGDGDNCRRFSEKYNAMLQEMKEHFLWLRGGDAG